ncbi:DnaA regulatory inactivator Hda [Methylomonas sp. MgM2]
MGTQLSLQFEFQTNLTFASFFPGDNAEIVNQLLAMAGIGTEQQIYIWGETGSGKSHLLQACCQQAKAEGKDPFFLAFDADNLPPTTILEGLEHIELVCFDDIQNIADHTDWERALFVFYNSHRQNNHKLLLSADCPPKFLPFDLPDLKTRMAWGLTLKIQPLHDQQIIEALTFKARYLGFDIPPKVGQFLLSHYVQDLPSLWLLLEKIDKATLAAQRKLTIPFLKQILAEQT